jgi:hypothetical protein
LNTYFDKMSGLVLYVATAITKTHPKMAGAG